MSELAALEYGCGSCEEAFESYEELESHYKLHLEMTNEPKL